MRPLNPIPVLYQDAQFVVFNKPANLLVVPTPNHETNTLTYFVNQQNPQTTGHLMPCHRLDRETTGAIIYARGRDNQTIMMNLFKKKKVFKQYLALVRGKLPYGQGEIRRPVVDFEQRKFHNRQASEVALTRYRILSVKRGYTVVHVFPLTGQTNQIRIHFAQIGHPLIGERKYAFGRDSVLKFRRVALHAEKISWEHPALKRKIDVSAPIPEDMKNFMSNN